MTFRLKTAAYLVRKPNAPGAVNATIHDRGDQRPDVFVLNCPFILVVPALVVAVNLRNVLEIALASLIANWAVQGVVRQ